MTRARIWNLGTIGVVLVVFLAGWFLLISPERTEAAELREQADDVADTNLNTEARIRQLQLQQKDLPKQQARLAEIKRMVPDMPALPALIRQLTVAGEESSVTVDGISPGTITDLAGSEDVKFIPVEITTVGRFADQKQFLLNIEENERSMLVTGFRLGRLDSSDEDDIDPDALELVVSTRVFMSSEAAAAAAGAPTATDPGSDAAGADADAAPVPDSAPVS